MKTLQLDCYFRLPDDFKGTFVDAVECFAKYCREKEEHRLKEEPEFPDVLIEVQDAKDNLLWKEFCTRIKDDNVNYVGFVGLSNKNKCCMQNGIKE